MIRSLLKDGNQGDKPTQPTNQTKPAEETAKETVTIPLQQETPAVPHQVTAESKVTYEDVTHISPSYRRYLTPQLTADLSEFSGLSLRLEENKAATHAPGTKVEREKLGNFPMRHARPFVIGVCGGNCAGKMDLVNYIIQSLDSKRCTVLKQENFYKPIPEQENIADYNYDDPDATDWEYMEQGLDALLYHRKAFHTPIYNFKLNKRDLATQEVSPNPIIIVEGLLIFHIEGIRKRLDLKIFLDTDDDIRLSRRIMKGYMQLGRDVDSIVDRYRKFVKPCHERYILPSRKFADIIVPNFGTSVCEELDAISAQKAALSGGDTEKKEEGSKQEVVIKVNVALELLVSQIKSQLEEMDRIRLFQKATHS